MRRLFFGIFLLGLFNACDDGDIIVTSFDFEESNLRFCDGTNKNVFYAINDADVFESFSVEFSESQIDVDEDTGNLIPTEEGETYSFELNGTNRAVYRIYNDEIPSGNDTYFCSVVPPSSPQVIEEWVSTGGTVVVFSEFSDMSGDTDIDGDGLSNLEENYLEDQDTDNDGIPDYLDRDDDGDNVYTERETDADIDENVNEDGYLDTDLDGIPNYLDDDDDNDGVLTRLEVSEETGLESPENFETAEGISNYLNEDQTEELDHNQYIIHDIDRNYRFVVRIDDLSMGNPDTGETIRFQTYNLGTYAQGNIDFPLCPSQDTECGDTDTEEPDEESEENEESN